MLFSVLIAVYKNEKPQYFREALKSIWDDQTVKPSEIVLVKDGPLTPELEKVIESYMDSSPIKVVSLKENQGLGIALCEGLKHCSYDLVARMDSDDISKPDRFEKQIQVFRKHPEYDIVGAWVDEFECRTTNVVSIRKLPEIQEDIYSFAKKRCPLNHPTVMFKKQSVLDADGYQPFPLHAAMVEDYFLWVRMLMQGCHFYNIQESLLFFRTSKKMYIRRGGWKYIKVELKLQRKFRQMGFINRSTYVQNVMIRFITRSLPNSIRFRVYKKLLHQKP